MTATYKLGLDNSVNHKETAKLCRVSIKLCLTMRFCYPSTLQSIVTCCCHSFVAFDVVAVTGVSLV